MRRFAIPAVAVFVAVGLLALLAFGVAHQGTSSSIDASVARGDYPMAPGAHTQLPILGVAGTVRASPTSAARSSWSTCSRPGASRAWPRRRSSSRSSASCVKHDATVLGVTYLDNSSDSEQFVQQHGITYPVVRDVSGNFVKGVRHGRASPRRS